jgi:hypothetical protein
MNEGELLANRARRPVRCSADQPMKRSRFLIWKAAALQVARPSLCKRNQSIAQMLTHQAHVRLVMVFNDRLISHLP